MIIEFVKYHGAGNDFIIVDNRKNTFDRKNNILVAEMCHRRFGIGADGLMLLQSHDKYDFEMVYYNSNGFEGTMCGNGGRCIVAYAKALNLFDKKTHFIAVDGEHKAEVLNNGDINLQIHDVDNVNKIDDYYFLDTGSPHCVVFKDTLDYIDVFAEGRRLRYDERFGLDGTNVNFVWLENDSTLNIRTYERGVENETLACGTGIVASSIAANVKTKSEVDDYTIFAPGGRLRVRFDKNDGVYSNVWLEGPAVRVYDGVANMH
ncbi:MAG: diaminopimelate epimerase [Bacteroidales bacterium]|nr:diaminopimelate epimerase [Bacteroidales bacterium]